ncbi:hypothetical protein [Paenibacillus senegalensis]|uniref:hypothetical protein n=1 Tax=Paenibacillus senegalensis TaxID=1465766 RepID=UPI0002882958|nr:hypothetical protein [Paenibacillus senegalensis]
MTYADLLLSPWTRIAAAVAAAAFFALLLGRYPWKTIARTTFLCLLLSYALTVSVLYRLHYGELFHRQKVLDRQHDYIQEHRPSEMIRQQGLVIAVSSREEGAGFLNRVYLGNYGEQPLREGQLVLRFFDENGRPLANRTLELSELQPGEQTTLLDVETDQAVANFQYQWTQLK